MDGVEMVVKPWLREAPGVVELLSGWLSQTWT